MNNPENWIRCGVCSSPTKFCYLKVQLCRSCAAFFRRAANENLSTRCQNKTTCTSKSILQCCRSCRYFRCLAIGARLKPKKRVEEQKSPVPEDPTTPAFLMPRALDGWTNLGEVIKAYDHFLLAQRLIHAAIHPESDVEFGKNILQMRRVAISRVESDSLPLMYEMFNEGCPAFRNLSTSMKIQVAAKNSLHFAFSNRAYLTSVNYPDENDLRMTVTNGFYMQVWPHFTPSFYHIEGAAKPGAEHHYINCMAPAFKKRFLIFREFKRLGLKKRDTASFVFLSMFQELENDDLVTDEMREFKEAVLAEWFEDIRRELGDKEAPLFFARAMGFFTKCEWFIAHMTDQLTMLSINTFARDDDQLHDYHSCAKKLADAFNCS